MTDTAKYADIVLPAASYLETDDLYRAYGAYWMQWGQQAAKPRGEARSNFDVAQALAQRMGLTDRIFTLSPQDAARELFKGATGPAAAADPAKLFAGEPIHIAHDWDGQPFKTPSGKLEFYSEQLARQGVSPVPDWNEDPVESSRRRQVAAPPADRAGLLPGPHRLLGRGLPARPRGQAVLRAASRGRREARPQADGDEVRLFNDRGAIGLVLQVSDEIQPGVVLVPGQRPTARRCRAPSTCCARTATPTWAKARPTRAPGSMSGRGRQRSRSRRNSWGRHSSGIPKKMTSP